MNISHRLLVSAALLAVAGSASAMPLDCAQNPVTDAYICFAPSEVREAAGMRSAPVYMGGPTSVGRTSLTVSVDCGAGLLFLKDRQGVKFAGAAVMNTSTPQSRDLLRNLCAMPIKAAKSAKARQ